MTAVTYPHERDMDRLREFREAAHGEILSKGPGVPRLMALAKKTSFDYALGIDPNNPCRDYRELFHRDVATALNGPPIVPQIFLVIAGLGSYYETPERLLLFTANRDRYAFIPTTELRVNVRSRWIQLIDAVALSAQGRHDLAKRRARDIFRLHDRLRNDTYYGIITLVDLFLSQLEGGDIGKAWAERERYIFTLTKKKADLYHPAGLLDLCALAICDVTRTAHTYRPPFVPLRAPLPPIMMPPDC
jgi:hypothetical protein